MAIFSCNISNVSRAKGSSSCATLSYITGLIVHEERTGSTFRYGRNERVVHFDTILPASAPEEYNDAATLFNAIENHEKPENARVAKKIMVALPRELDLSTQRDVVEEYIRTNLTAVGYAATYAIHLDKEGNNPHAHILIANRTINEKGEWSTKSKKDYALDENGERIPVIDPATGQQKVDKRNRKQWKRVNVQVNPLDAKDMLLQLRESWAAVCNTHLPEEQHIDHRSHAERGLDTIPTIHEGYAARELEARGEESERCQSNRIIKKQNQALRETRGKIKEIDSFIEKYNDFIEKIQGLVEAVFMVGKAAAPSFLHIKETMDGYDYSFYERQSGLFRYKVHAGDISNDDLKGISGHGIVNKAVGFILKTLGIKKVAYGQVSLNTLAQIRQSGVKDRQKQGDLRLPKDDILLDISGQEPVRAMNNSMVYMKGPNGNAKTVRCHHINENTFALGDKRYDTRTFGKKHEGWIIRPEYEPQGNRVAWEVDAGTLIMTANEFGWTYRLYDKRYWLEDSGIIQGDRSALEARDIAMDSMAIDNSACKNVSYNDAAWAVQTAKFPEQGIPIRTEKGKVDRISDNSMVQLIDAAGTVSVGRCHYVDESTFRFGGQEYNIREVTNRGITVQREQHTEPYGAWKIHDHYHLIIDQVDGKWWYGYYTDTGTRYDSGTISLDDAETIQAVREKVLNKVLVVGKENVVAVLEPYEDVSERFVEPQDRGSVEREKAKEHGRTSKKDKPSIDSD